jgi:hypothetical protein
MLRIFYPDLHQSVVVLGWSDRLAPRMAPKKPGGPLRTARRIDYFLPLPLACASALPAMLLVRADDRPSLSAFDALLATRELVTLPRPPRATSLTSLHSWGSECVGTPGTLPR